MTNYYKDFIDFSKNELDEYFKNVKLYKNQFCFDDDNEFYYKKLFLEQRHSEKIKTVAELKKEIPGYKDLYSDACKYYMSPRNSSKKIYDVQMGIKLEDLLIDFLKTKFKLNIRHADRKNRSYPDCMLLGKDKGILAYFDLKYHGAPFIQSKNKIGREPYEGSTTLDLNKVKKQINIVDSELDRPMFYLHWIDYHDLKGIFFESSDQVKKYIYENGADFERKDRSGDYKILKKVGYTEKIYSPLFNMGTFEEFVDVLIDLKNNGVPDRDFG